MVQVRILAAERRTRSASRAVDHAWRAPWPWEMGWALHEDEAEAQDDLLPTITEMSDAWLVGRAREHVAVVQRADLDTQLDVVADIDDMLAEAQRRGEPRMVGQLLRAAVMVRLSTPGTVDELDPLLDEMLAHTQRHGLVVLEAGTRALRGRRALLANADDVALVEVAKALAMLDEDIPPDVLLGRRASLRMLAGVLNDLALMLTELGVYEQAEQVMVRIDSCVKEGGGPHEIAIHLINRTRLLLGWAIRLERVGEDDRAGEQLARASAIASAAEGPFRESLFPRDDARAAADQVHILGAAHALAAPGEQHVARLEELVDNAVAARDLIFTGIALARCLERAHDVERAVDVLGEIRERLAEDASDPTLRLSLVREFARLSGPEGGERTTSALENYAADLEAELWVMRRARIATLNARREHERLSREHGAVTQQALQDPLTGLPNRRALDERLDLIAAQGNQPLSIALIDLDGFKFVNDRCSHAEGDDVLRVVASTVRDTLRGGDLVARYGGDEFVALLPGAPLNAAEAALGRAVSAVAELPTTLSRGVTLSVGVVSLRAHESGNEALARADAAMYLAKRRGGNSVAAVTPGGGHEGPDWLPPDPQQGTR